MTPKQIVAHIRTMRDREGLSEIIDAAEARDCHLSNIESDDRRKRAWAHFSHLKRGDTVFVHVPQEKGPYVHLYGRPLKVVEVKPRAKEITVTTGNTKNNLTALVALSLKLSEVPTGAAFANSLHPEGMERDRIKPAIPSNW